MDRSDLIDPLDLIAESIQDGNSEMPVELFTDDREDSDGIALKTDLKPREHVLVTCIIAENQNLKKLFGDDFDLYGDFLNQFRRHKVSLDRNSRKEFVTSVARGISDNDLQQASNIKNIVDSRT